MLFQTVTIHLWPLAQKCMECENSLECMDNEKGIITGIPNHPFILCGRWDNDNYGPICRGFIPKKEIE